LPLPITLTTDFTTVCNTSTGRDNTYLDEQVCLNLDSPLSDLFAVVTGDA